MEQTDSIITVQEKNVTEEVLARVNDLSKKGELLIPSGYSPENALKSAWLILQETIDKDKKLVLQTCSKSSTENALLNMVIQGLSPVKKQCYFVAYGGKLELMRSYMGTVAVTKRLKGINDIKAYCIYAGDEFETEYNIDTAVLKITKFNPKFENIDNLKIKGAFAVVLGDEGPIYTEIMNFNQIKRSWGQGTAYSSGKSTAHNHFTEEMAKKTVINRACKMFANTSDDSDILIEAFNNSDVDEDPVEDIKTEIKDKANSKVIDFEEKKEIIQEAEIIETAPDIAEAETSKKGPSF